MFIRAVSQWSTSTDKKREFKKKKKRLLGYGFGEIRISENKIKIRNNGFAGPPDIYDH